MRKFIAAVTFLFSVNLGFSQKVIYDTKSFGDCEAIEANVSSQKFSIYIAQKELREGYGGRYELSGGQPITDNVNPPNNFVFMMDVNFKNGLKFPIEEKDSVYVSLSNVKKGYDDDMNMRKQIESKNYNRIEKEKQNFEISKKSVQDQIKELTKKFQAGKISTDEFGDKLKELSDPLLKQVETSYFGNIAFIEPEEKTTYSINFVNTYEQIESQAFSGILHIKKFNKDELVVSFSGNHMVNCLAKRAATSREEEEKCKANKSCLMKEFYVLREGNVTGNINVKLKKFNDYR
ncbi:hypothetical protein BTO06_13890 [Tenacibaculum sp. SZ-18]|uniref:hypothetical protein n=1 Tax=Tenacibaculum sp. SZ-18 TaxID=754423 RepID=UPI000C2CF1A0|nr:hypothetical protein [Tenacibaculum sp. SZ-18]AUC16185.1 hypothetical protein BTO06_13890 [Tenacibaculum sp. SZ-18]